MLESKTRAEKQERVFGRGWSLVKDLNAVQRSEPVRGCMAHLPPPTITTATAVDGLDGGGGAAAGATINCHWWAAADAGASVTTGGGGAAGASTGGAGAAAGGICRCCRRWNTAASEAAAAGAGPGKCSWCCSSPAIASAADRSSMPHNQVLRKTWQVLRGWQDQ